MPPKIKLVKKPLKLPKADPNRVAAPSVTELPFSLPLSTSAVPAVLTSSCSEFTQAQSFFSALERVVPELTSGQGYKNCWSGIPSESIAAFTQKDPDSHFMWTLTLKDGTQAPVFLKRAHLLDPINYMSGTYLTPSYGGLPAPAEPWRNALEKMNDPNNEAYVDALFALYANQLVSHNISPHWCRCYGTFTACANTYMYDITEEYDSLKRHPWWNRNQRNGLFTIFHDEEDTAEFKAIADSEGTDLGDGDFQELTEDLTSASISHVVSHADEPALDGAKPVRLRTPKIRFKPIASSDSEGDDDDESEEEDAQFAEFTNFPVQVTLLECADETLEDLADDDAETPLAERDEKWTAWLFQIIAALSCAQHLFGFAHNDLHSNNVMWSATEKTHLTYRIHNKKDVYTVRVPTYGKLMKIIDFGRASYTLPCGFFISDAFYPGNDAAEQYNCEPFYDPKEGPKLEPNPSFDLCRLSVSLIDSLFPERPAAASPVRIMSKEPGKMYTETVSPVYNLLWSWLLDDEGINVLRTPDGDERYPEFDLYCALAADVHGAVPKHQLLKPLFQKFKTTGVVTSEPVYDLFL
jgi:hypothetical protein